MNNHFFNYGTDTFSGRIDRIARMKRNERSGEVPQLVGVERKPVND